MYFHLVMSGILHYLYYVDDNGQSTLCACEKFYISLSNFMEVSSSLHNRRQRVELLSKIYFYVFPNHILKATAHG
jgi:hypothetical protein